jgi:hypothetical protein
MRLEPISNTAPHIKAQYRVTNVTDDDVKDFGPEFATFLKSLKGFDFISPGTMSEFTRQVRDRFVEK